MAGASDHNRRDIEDEPDLTDEEITKQAWAKRNLLSLDGGGVRGYWSLLALEKLMEYVGEEELRQNQNSTHSYYPLKYLPYTTHVDCKGHDTTTTCAESGWEQVSGLSYAQRYLPCHYFDFIGGSSTGGLIAIMLGRLRMTVEDCIEEYERLSNGMFGDPRHFTTLRYYLIDRNKYDTQSVEAVFEDVFERRGENPTGDESAEREFRSEAGVCQTTVVTIRSERRAAGVVDTRYFIRSYDYLPSRYSPTTSRAPSKARTFISQDSEIRRQRGLDAGLLGSLGMRRDRNEGKAHRFSISKVARAVTAAPFYFDSLQVETKDEHFEFSDGGMGVTNNPTKAMVEHLEKHINLPVDADYGKLQTVVSIGTARHDASQHREHKRLGQKVKGAYAKWSDPQDIHCEMKSDYVEKRWHQHDYFFYYRLNPNVSNQHHLLDLDLDDWRPKTGSQPGCETLKTIQDKFHAWYANDAVARKRIHQCAADLVAQRRARMIDAEKWERYAQCARYDCDGSCEVPNTSYAFRTDFCKHLQQSHGMDPRDSERVADNGRRTWTYKFRNEPTARKPTVRSRLRLASEKLFKFASQDNERDVLGQSAASEDPASSTLVSPKSSYGGQDVLGQLSATEHDASSNLISLKSEDHDQDPEIDLPSTECYDDSRLSNLESSDNNQHAISQLLRTEDYASSKLFSLESQDNDRDTVGRPSGAEDYVSSDDGSDISDVSSLWSRQSSESSTSSAYSTPDVRQKAAEHLAQAICNDPELRALYEQGALKYGKAKLLENSDKLLKRLFIGLREISTSDQQVATIRLLREKRQRTTLNNIVYSTVKPSQPEDKSLMESLRLNKEDREYLLNRLLSSNVGTSRSGEEPVASEQHEISDYDSDEFSEDEQAADGHKLNNKNPEPLESVMKFLTETRPFDQFRTDLRNFISPPTTLTGALEAGNTKLVRRMIVNDFQTHACGPFEWLQDLQDTGFDLDEIADILTEDVLDAPWIRFELPERSLLQICPGKHVSQCAHTLCGDATDTSGRPADHKPVPNFTKSTSMQRTVQEFCGLGGVRPCTDDKAAWGGTVLFDEAIGTARISYGSNDISLPSRDITTLNRTIDALDQFLSAASTIQAASQCCDSFTLLLHAFKDDKRSCYVELRRIAYHQALCLMDDARTLRDSVRPSLVELGRASMSATNIICALLSAEDWQPLSEPMAFDQVVHLCALAAQLLCIGLLSYSQAHISPIEPFFLDHALTEIQLTGSGKPDSIAICAYLVTLSCMGGMTGRPVIAFASSTSSIIRDADVRHDVLASTEDLLDTFGPGKLVFSAPDDLHPCAVLLRGGLLTANAGDAETLHWDRVRRLDRSLPQFHPAKKLLIGMLWNVNVSCTFDERLCRRRVTLEPLGTSPDSWDLAQHQAGAQAGLYVVGTYNSTYCKVAGTTLKDRILGKTDDMLLLDLEDTWGVRVSACTAVACRVPLRTLLADVLPIFARADGLSSSRWTSLETNHHIVAGLRLPNFIDFVGQLDEHSQRYLMTKIRSTLELLRYTGMSKDRTHFTVAWPHDKDVQRGLSIPCEKESYWTRMLADTVDCATFAYMSPLCLESGHRKCRGGTPIWQNATKALVTAVSLHQRMTTPLSTCSGASLPPSWRLIHDERYIIGADEVLLKIKVHKPPTSSYALLRPTVLEIPSKFGKRVVEKLAKQASGVARLRERQNPDDEAENVLVTCNV